MCVVVSEAMCNSWFVVHCTIAAVELCNWPFLNIWAEFLVVLRRTLRRMKPVCSTMVRSILHLSTGHIVCNWINKRSYCLEKHIHDNLLCVAAQHHILELFRLPSCSRSDIGCFLKLFGVVLAVLYLHTFPYNLLFLLLTDRTIALLHSIPSYSLFITSYQ